MCNNIIKTYAKKPSSSVALKKLCKVAGGSNNGVSPQDRFNHHWYTIIAENFKFKKRA